MKKLLLASTVLAGLTATASAADLPRRAAPPPVYNPIPVFTWTGFYAGFNAGYGFGTNDDRGATTITDPTGATGLLVAGNAPVAGTISFNNRSSEGFVGGGQIGYNWQLTPGSGVVIGVEADAQYVDFGRRNGAVPSTGTALNPGVDFANPNGVSGLDFFGTARGRLGYAFDRTLVYGTGGFAYGSGGGNTNVDDFRTGWVAGGGIEYALPTDSFLNFFKSSAVTFKVEGLYVNLDRNSTNGNFGFVDGRAVANVADPRLAVTNFQNRNSDEFAVVRAGINYKFGSY